MDKFTKMEQGDSKADIVKIESGARDSSVQEFKFQTLKREGQGSYAATKAKFGSLAVTDPEKTKKGSRDSRFAINPLLRNQLAIEDEETRILEKKLQERIDILTAEVTKTAEKKGYEEGIQRGRDEAFKKFQEQGQQDLAKLENFVNEFEGLKEKVFQANERFLVELVFRVSKMLALKDLSVDKTYVSRLASQLIERIGVRENISIKISSKELQTVSQIKDDLEKKLGSLKNLKIEASEQVVSGGCLLETDWNMIDARLETQINGLHEALVGQQPVQESDNGQKP